MNFVENVFILLYSQIESVPKRKYHKQELKTNQGNQNESFCSVPR